VEAGVNVVLLNQRNGGTEHLGPGLYHPDRRPRAVIDHWWRPRLKRFGVVGYFWRKPRDQTGG
jgi:hypothetical protein